MMTSVARRKATKPKAPARDARPALSGESSDDQLALPAAAA
jgi:hypothetical protein